MSASDDQIAQVLNSDAFDENFIMEIVENKLNVSRTKFKAVLVLITPATKSNENYMSLVCRIKIKYQLLESKLCESFDVIAKISLAITDALGDFSVYQREKFMYENVLSSFEQIWYEKVGEKIQFGPKSLNFKNKPNEMIVLDDLKAQNYELVDRIEGLNLEQTKFFLSKFAKFHAVSAAKYQKDGTLNNFLDRNSSSAPEPDTEGPLAKILLRIFDEFLQSLKSFGDCDCYVEKISKLDRNIIATGFMNESIPMDCGFTVLNHGDIWTNNMMFRFNPDDVILIDFQLCFWGSPFYDFLAFISMSVKDEIKVKHFDEIVEFYLHELVDALKKIGYDKYIPTLDEFKIEMMNKGYILVGFLPFLFFAKYSSSEAFTFETLMQENDEKTLREIYDRVYSDDYYIKAVRSWLPFLEERGFLDSFILKK